MSALRKAYRNRMKSIVPDLSHLCVPGTVFEIRATPRAAANRIWVDPEGVIRIAVTASPEGGKANAAVTKLLAGAIGVSKSSLLLIRGRSSRYKLFRIEL